MKHLFDALDDQTPPSTGAEIGAAIAPALADIAKAGERQAQMVAQAIAQALREIGRAQPQPANIIAPAQITEWVFDVQRDRDGNMTRVVATAETAPQFKRTGLS